MVGKPLHLQHTDNVKIAIHMFEIQNDLMKCCKSLGRKMAASDISHITARDESGGNLSLP